MIEKIKDLIGNAIIRFSEKEGVRPIEISLAIHTKNEDCLPQYYYMVGKSSKKDKNGDTLDLDFVSDIMGKKFDFLNYSGNVAFFIQQKFKFFESFYTEQQFLAKRLYLFIRPTNDEAKDFIVLLYHNTEKVKTFTIEELFEM